MRYFSLVKRRILDGDEEKVRILEDYAPDTNGLLAVSDDSITTIQRVVWMTPEEYAESLMQPQGDI